MTNTHQNYGKVEAYLGANALDNLLTDLTAEVVALQLKIADKLPLRDWAVEDIHPIEDQQHVLVCDERTLYYTVIAIDNAYPTILLALGEDLLQREALINALHPNNEDYNVRLCLSEGVRTPRSKQRGFRWYQSRIGMRNMLNHFEHQDIYALAREAILQEQDDEVMYIKATTEEIQVIVKRAVVARYPFDHYPFVGARTLQSETSKLTGHLIDILNAAMKSLQEDDERND